MPAPTPRPSRFLSKLALTLGILVGLAVRWIDFTDTLWLDEIWSLAIASSFHDLRTVLREALQENSHLLTTVWLYWVADLEAPWLYRLPSLFYSCLTLLVGVRLGRRLEGPERRWIHAWVFGTSAFLVHYGTEARGYSGLLFHSLAGIYLLDLLTRGRGVPPKGPRPTAHPLAIASLFGVNALFGLFNQPLFVSVLVGSAAWFGVRAARPVGSRSRLGLSVLVQGAAALWLPLAALYGVWHWAPSVQRSGTGSDLPLFAAWQRFLQFGFGIPPWWVLTSAGTLLLAVLAWRARREADSEADRRLVELLVLLVVAAVAVPFLVDARLVQPRYLSAALPPLYLLAIRGAAGLAARGRPWRLSVAIIGLLFLTGQALTLTSMLRAGRGHYLEAAREMAVQDPSPVIRVATDHPLHGASILNYFGQQLESPRAFEVMYLTAVRPTSPPRWIILHDKADHGRNPGPVIEVEGVRYLLWGVYEKYGLSGWNWSVYFGPAARP